MHTLLTNFNKIIRIYNLCSNIKKNVLAILRHRMCLKGDDRSFSKWLPWKLYFNYTFYVGLGHKMYMLCLYKYISVFEWTYSPKLREMVHALFRKRNSFNNARNDGTFGIDVVDSVPNTLLILELANVSQLFTLTGTHYHTQWSPNIILLFM